MVRDEGGRIIGLSSGEQHTSFSYDEACQLVEARTGGAVDRWRYDASGRLVAETVDGLTVEHTYDAAGQLVASTDSERTTHYTHDGAGRRVREESSDGHVRTLAWSPTGWLSTVTDQLPGGGSRRTETHVDATGMLAEVDGTDIHWDAASFAPTPVQAGDTPVLAAGPVTGVGDTWTTPGWRTQRSTGADPWAATGGTGAVPGLAAGVAIGADGGLSVAGMEWLGARVYDPASRGFLSVDPLDPVTGAGWAGNPYSYAGNDPLHALDPQGLKPLTDADLRAYNAANNTGFAAAYDWAKDNWEYLAGGAMVIAGGVLIATGVGGPLGGALIGAGVDTIIQKATTGSVNWGQVAVMGVAGAAGGALAAARVGTTGLRAAVLTGSASGAASGGAGNGYLYATGPGPHSVGGFLSATAQGTVYGGLMGGAGGAAGHGLETLGGRVLNRVMPAVETPYGPAAQELSRDALRARTLVNEGAPIYRIGTMGRSQAAEGQFWALEHPSTPGYAGRYGIPEENVMRADFIEQARVPEGGQFITRSAPGIGDNPGGGIEVVIPEGSADLDWFSTMSPKDIN